MRLRFRHMDVRTVVVCLLGLCVAGPGCQTPRAEVSDAVEPRAVSSRQSNGHPVERDRPPFQDELTEDSDPIEFVSLTQPEFPASDEPVAAYSLEDVIASVYRAYPSLQASFFNRNIAQGEHLSAQGNFDTKLKGASENGPTGFYQTYRHSLGIEQPTYWGGSVFGGYRIGRGDYQPWYLERQTNDGGEFKAGVSMPLLRNRAIDERRAQLGTTAQGTHLVEPRIHQDLIDFVQMASEAYWAWVATGQKYRIQQQLLSLAETRNTGIEREVELGARDPPDLEDNRRSIVSREAKVIAARQKFQQASFKLSIFLRDINGVPIVLAEDQLPVFPELESLDLPDLDADIQTAFRNRPELLENEILREQIDIERALAENDALPNVDAVILGSQDVGEPTSPKRDKSEFELEAGIFVDVPLQRRKARGKQVSLEGKASQLVLKRGLIEDKIVAELQSVHAALQATIETVEKTQEAVRLANYMAEVEQKKFNAGTGDLFTLNLREQQAAEAAENEVDALLEYFRANAAYRAILARDHQ
ncbi:MAG TPA: TolC family protein, partial [Planctomycetaceae bacterium]|nr:TolC family protein [Planctomycetaceae bacterium]